MHQTISIHALLAESDPNPVCIMITIIISIHALLAESDPPYNLMIHHEKNFYPRSPCGERRFRLRRTYLDTIISIHALLAESDLVSDDFGKKGT